MILVQHILEEARPRLSVLRPEASICDAAEILTNPSIPLVVVCDSEGIAVGVLSRSDILKAFSRARGDAINMNAEAIMTKAFLSCHVDQTLQSVWTNLNARSLRCAPVLDDSRKPQGVVHARDVARALVDEVAGEEALLRDYVLGIGYQ
jgi:CBS domain-containing protein